MKTIIYGAGNIARQMLANSILRKENIYGIAVTHRENNPEMLWEFPVKSIEDYQCVCKDVRVILGLSENYHKEIIKHLKILGFERIEKRKALPLKYSNFIGVEKKKFISAWYFANTGKRLDWENLCTYNEKMQWIKLYDNPEQKTLLTDKYKVRKYVKDKIGEKYLIPLLGVWDCFDDIDFRSLPDQFVLKCNHGCGWNQIVEDKCTMDLIETKNKFDQWMATNYTDIAGLELQYTNIDRKIIAEEFLIVPGEMDIPDYKIFVFDGEVKLIQTDFGRREKHTQALYSPQWEYLPYSLLCKTDPDSVIPKPSFLEEMIEVAKRLAEGFRHVRVDLYQVDGKIYFGEMTFTHCGGIGNYSPEEFGYIMGDWMKLPEDYKHYLS